MVATSANAWATSMSTGLMSPGSTWNRLSAPSTDFLSRIGSACTDRKPASSASTANLGQRSPAAARSRFTTGAPGAIAVETRAFFDLNLEQLEHPHGRARRSHQPQTAIGRRHHQTPRRRHRAPRRSDRSTASTARRRRSRPRACPPVRRGYGPVSLLWASHLRRPDHTPATCGPDGCLRGRDRTTEPGREHPRICP